MTKRLPGGGGAPELAPGTGGTCKLVAVEFVDYSGSFAVSGCSHRARARYVKEKLRTNTEYPASSKRVLLLVSPAGITIYNLDGTVVHSAHPLDSISYSRCDPEGSRFAFLARSPGGTFRLQSCHTFRAQSREQAEELNTVVGRAFRIAYSTQAKGRSRPNSRESGERSDAGSVPSFELKSINAAASSRPSRQKGLPGFPWNFLDEDHSVDSVGGITIHRNVLTSCAAADPLRRLRQLVLRKEAATPAPAPAELLPNNLRAPPLPDGADKADRRCSSRQSKPSNVAREDDAQPVARSKKDACAPEDEEARLKKAAWFQAGIPRELALEVLSDEPVGSFLVRQSGTQPGCFALTMRVPGVLQPVGTAHYLIVPTPRGYRIKGFAKEFPSLYALIVHHSVMPELLPCPLALSRYARPPLPTSLDLDFEDIEADGQSVADV